MGDFTYSSNVTPGQLINLLAGMKPDVQAPFSSIVREGTREGIDKVLEALTLEECFFGPFPELVPCINWSQLVAAFFSRFKVKGRSELFASSAVLQIHGGQYGITARDLADKLGIHPDDARDDSGYSFVLARVPRNISGGVVNLPSGPKSKFREQLVKECTKTINDFAAELEQDEFGSPQRIPANILKTLGLVDGQLGSHYVEEIQIGDEAYQVFVYKADRFKLICGAMDKSGWEGESALGFRYFTSSDFCEYGGRVSIRSQDPGFAKVRKWLGDTSYGLSESVFSLLLNEHAQEEAQKIRNLVCVAARLASVTELQSENSLRQSKKNRQQNRYAAGSLLDSVAVQGCITRFGAAGAGPAAFTDDTDVDYARLYAAFGQMDRVSLLWSPYLSLSQMYVRLDELWKMPALNKEGVSHLLITADVIEIQEDIDLSNVETVTFACRLFIAGKNGRVPSIKLSSSARNPLRLYCGSMKGTCSFEEKGNPERHQLVFDTLAFGFTPEGIGINYEDFFAGKFPIEPFYETDRGVYSQWCKTALQTGLDTLLLSASVPLSPQSLLDSHLRETAVEAWSCLKWISDFAGQAVEEAKKKDEQPPEELAQVYTHSVMQLRAVVNPNDHQGPYLPQVPALRYTAYESAVNRLLDVSKEYARQIDNTGKAIDAFNQELEKNYVDEQRDENIKKLAQFMVDQNKAMAQHEEDLTLSHNDIINKKKETIQTLKIRQAEIEDQYDEYSKKLEDAQKDLEEAIRAKQTAETIKLVVDTLVGLGEILCGIIVGTYGLKTMGSAQGAEKTLKKFEAFMKFAEETSKLVEITENFVEQIGALSDLSKSTPPSFTEPPTNEDWEIFMNDCEATIRPAEEYVKREALNYIAAIRNLTVVAKSLNGVLAQKAQLEYDIFAEESSRKVSQRHGERLNELSINLNTPTWEPDMDYLADLGQFNALLRQKQNAALLKLAEMVRLQNNSMTFHYLSKPTLITQFDIASIQEGLAAQALAAVQTLDTYPYPPTDLNEPIEVRVENVPIQQLTSDMGLEIQVQMNQGLFDSLAHVRINSLDVRIDGVATNTGKCHVQMESLGNPMLDRGLGMQRETLSFQMISREWHVVYDIDRDKTIIGTQPAKEWGKYFTKPTPFQTFRVSLPMTAENAGLRFARQVTTVTLSFMLEAAYSKPPIRTSLNQSPGLKGNKPGPRGNLRGDLGVPRFLELLKGYTVTDGWDVVSFFSVDKINDLWKQRWDSETSEAFAGKREFLQEIKVSHTLQLPGKISVEYELEADAGPPWLEFVADNSQSALLNIPLLRCQLTTTTRDKEGNPLGQEIDEISTSVEKPVLIKTKAALKKLAGEVDANTVYIDPAQDTFILENIELDPQVDIGICNEIVEYFKKQKLEPWKLGTLRLNSEIDFLKPTAFQFQTYTPPETHKQDWPALLAIYTLTTTANPPTYGMRQVWPDACWPVSADFDAAVYFSADLLWENEIIPAVKEQIPDCVINKESKSKVYFVELRGKQEVYNQKVEIKHGWQANKNYQIVTENAKVNFPFEKADPYDGHVHLKFNLSALELDCDQEWDEDFPYQKATPLADPMCADVKLSTGWDKVHFTCDFNSISNPKIDPDSLEITFEKFDINPDVDAVYSHQDLWTLYKVKQSVIENAKTEIEKKVSGLNINLRAMPMFAVSNLLFPESKTIEPAGVYCPRDLVIIGDVVREWKPQV